MLAKVLKRAGIGFAIGMFVGNIIAILTGTSSTNGVTFASKQLLNMAAGNPVIAMVFQSLFSGLYGALCFAGMSFYDAERIPLAAATSLHAALIILTFIPIALLLGWVSGIIEILIIAFVQLAAFFIIWLIMYLIFKKQVKELNEMQEHFSKQKKL